MFAAHLKRYRIMILFSIFFFYLGCKVTLSFMNVECVEAVLSTEKMSEYEKVEYAVLIMSGPDGADYKTRRNSIRQTWLNLVINNGLYPTSSATKKGSIKFYFVIGIKGLDKQKLLELTTENSKNNDMLLLEDLEDSYKNLAQKMVKSLEWFSNNFIRLKYLIKCDDDSFVRVDMIVRELENFAPGMSAPEISEYVSYKKTLPSYKGLYWGYFNGKARVYQKGKWQEDEWFLSNNYLPYALGGGYVISRSIVDFVAKNAESLSLYQSEDVSMGVWTAPLADINRVHDIRFDTEWKSRGCSDHMLIRHKQTANDMFGLFNTLVNSKGLKLCKVEAVVRKPYHYNWNTLPNSCCTNSK